ncbi:MAG: 2-amino-4-hydroxy-6-hydroxymethyldihydropteridine diphosphokinase [Conexivisphaerales archaeon]
MVKIYLELGSNIMPDVNIDIALGHIRRITKLEEISTVYRTEPIGQYSGYFYNCVVGCQTELDPLYLKKIALPFIETKMGRPVSRKGPDNRTIDIDMLIYDDLVNETLSIPHNDIFNKPFVAFCLCEIAPNLRILPLFKTACDISSNINKTGMIALREYTNKLRAKYLF